MISLRKPDKVRKLPLHRQVRHLTGDADIIDIVYAHMADCRDCFVWTLHEARMLDLFLEDCDLTVNKFLATRWSAKQIKSILSKGATS